MPSQIASFAIYIATVQNMIRECMAVLLDQCYAFLSTQSRSRMENSLRARISIPKHGNLSQGQNHWNIVAICIMLNQSVASSKPHSVWAWSFYCRSRTVETD